MKKNFKNFLIYYGSFVIGMSIVGWFFGFIVNGSLYKTNHVLFGNEFALKVLRANSLNFLIYLLMPVLSPVFQAMDLIRTFFAITVAIRIDGFLQAIKDILPHALLELPNLLFYQGISQWLLFNLIITKDIKDTLKKQWSYAKLYVISYMVLVIAALVEGYWG